MTTANKPIPVTVTPEAAARIAELGFKPQIEQMIEQARHLPDVVRIEVVLNERYDMGGEPGVAVEAYGTRLFDANDRTDPELVRWGGTTFPSEILEHLLLTYTASTPHQR